MSLSEKELKKKVAELDEIEVSQTKKKYKGYKKGFTRKYTKYK